MALTTKSTLDNAFRIRYQKYGERAYAIGSIFLQTAKPKFETVAPGQKISFDIESSSGAGYGYSSEGFLVEAGSIVPERGYLTYKEMNLTAEWLASVIDDAQGKGYEAAEYNPIDRTIKSKLMSQRRDFNFDLLNSDGSGLIASPASSAAATSVVVDTIRGVRKGMIVDVLLRATGQVGPGGVRGARINVARGTKTLTFDNSKQFADGSGADVNANPEDYGVYRAGSWNDAIFGLPALVSDANPPTGIAQVGEIDRSLDANDWYRAHVHNNTDAPGTGRRLTFEMIAELVDAIKADSPVDFSNMLILSGSALRNQLITDLKGNRRYNARDEMLNGWARGIVFDGLDAPWVVDYQLPDDRVYVLNMSTIDVYQNDKGKWMDKDGSYLDRIKGRTAYQAAWYWRGQTCIRAPIANGVLTDLDATAEAA